MNNDTKVILAIIVICLASIAAIWHATVAGHQRRQAAAVSCHEAGGQWVETTSAKLCLTTGQAPD